MLRQADREPDGCPSGGLKTRGTTPQLSKAAAVEPQTRRAEGGDYAKANAAASKTTTSDRRARGGGVIETHAKAKRISISGAMGGGGRRTWRWCWWW